MLIKPLEGLLGMTVGAIMILIVCNLIKLLPFCCNGVLVLFLLVFGFFMTYGGFRSESNSEVMIGVGVLVGTIAGIIAAI